jgi:hypothetical protein
MLQEKATMQWLILKWEKKTIAFPCDAIRHYRATLDEKGIREREREDRREDIEESCEGGRRRPFLE